MEIKVQIIIFIFRNHICWYKIGPKAICPKNAGVHNISVVPCLKRAQKAGHVCVCVSEVVCVRKPLFGGVRVCAIIGRPSLVTRLIC